MNYTKLSNGISWVLHPFVLPVYMIVLLLTATTFALYPANVKFYLLWVVVLYAVIIPVLALGVLRSLGRISDFRVDDRRERLLPLLVGTGCYVLCAVTISKIPSVVFLRKFMVAAACCEAMCFAVSLRWKISLHLTGMGAAVALLVVMNVAGVGHMLLPLTIALLGAGALASARLYLGCHNGRHPCRNSIAAGVNSVSESAFSGIRWRRASDAALGEHGVRPLHEAADIGPHDVVDIPVRLRAVLHADRVDIAHDRV